MKIVFSASGYPPSRGGAESLCRHYAEGLAARGHQVEVIAPDLFFSDDFYSLKGRPVSEGVDQPSRVPVHRISYVGAAERAGAERLLGVLPGDTLKALATRALVWPVTRRFHHRLHRALVRSRPDVVVALVHLHPNVRASLVTARRLGTTAVVMPLLHEEDPHWPAAGVRECVALADAVLALTDGEAEALVRNYGAAPDRVFVVGVGVDPARALPPAAPADPTILFLGRKTAGKGLPLLADALAVLLGRGVPFRAALVGARADDTAAMEERYRALLGDRLVSVTDASDEEKERWLGDCTCLVLPSDRESFGIVLLEAWSHAKPVVTIDYPVAREIVADGIDGLLVRKDDPVALADALERLLRSVGLAGAMGAAGRDKVERRYRWASRIDALERACSIQRKPG